MKGGNEVDISPNYRIKMKYIPTSVIYNCTAIIIKVKWMT